MVSRIYPSSLSLTRGCPTLSHRSRRDYGQRCHDGLKKRATNVRDFVSTASTGLCLATSLPEGRYVLETVDPWIAIWLHYGAFLLQADRVVALHRLQRNRSILLEHQQIPKQGVHVMIRLRRGLQEPAAPIFSLCCTLSHRYLPHGWTLIAFVPNLLENRRDHL